jgi:Flp pilus assembly protein TadG
MRRPTARLKGFCTDRSGGSAIEFALVAPIFLICAFALFQVGFGIYSQSTISRVAHEGARHLLFSPADDQGARQTMMDTLGGTALDAEQMQTTIETLSAPYPHIRLVVNYRYQPLGPFPLPEEMLLSAIEHIPLEAE